MARCSRSASVHLGCVYRFRGVGSTRGLDSWDVIVLMVVVVNWCVSRIVVAKVGPVGSGMCACVGIGGSVRVDFVCW